MADTMVEILKAQSDVKLVGATADVDEALRQLEHCDTLVVSAALPNRSALTLIERVKREKPGVKVIVMDLCKDGDGARQYLQAGAAVCIYEEDTIGDLLQMARA